jgi:tetratricopeptide (TPR) repeat protein
MNRARTRSGLFHAAGLSFLALAASAAPGSQATAQDSAVPLLRSFRIDPENPESRVPSAEERERNPIAFGHFMMDVTTLAEEASKRGDHAAAIKYYRALAVAVPDHSVAFTKLCSAYEAAGDLARAERACGTALTRAGVGASNFADYVRVVFAQESALSADQVENVRGVAEHLRQQGGDPQLIREIECELAARAADLDGLAKCTAALAQQNPRGAKTITYQWLLAMRRHDYDSAEDALARAKRSGASADIVERMEQQTLAAQAPQRRRRLVALGLFCLISVVVGGALWFMRHQRTWRDAQT